MAKEIKDIKRFLEIARRKDATSARVKKTLGKQAGSQPSYKFKIRCSRYLYTINMKDAEKADKLRQALPPTLNVQDVDGASGKKSKAAKK